MNTMEFNKRLHQARYSAECRNFSDALKFYADLTRELPLLANLWEEYGRAAGTAGEHELADQCWQKTLEIGPRNAGLLLRLSEQYSRFWLHEKARALAKEAAELEPHILRVQIYLMSLISQGGPVGEAREVVNRCLKLDPKCEPARYYAALLDQRE